MILMNMTDRKKLFCSTLAVTVLVLGSMPFAYGQERTPFEKLTDRFKQGKIFNAGFGHVYIDSYTGDTLRSEGKIWVGENRYKVQSKKQTVIVNGKTSMVYDEQRNRVIISKYEPEEDDFAPSRILNGIDSTFSVETQQQKKNEVYIKLVSDDPFAIYQKVEIYLTAAALIPERIEAVDPADNLIVTTFENGKFIRIEQDMFSLDYPANAEIVDMRN